MNRIRSLMFLGASLGVAGCADQASSIVGPEALAKVPGEISANVSSGGKAGYTWTIKKELVVVYKGTSDGGMAEDKVSPHTINPLETKWFHYRITWTRTNGGKMGPTAVVSDDFVAACSSLGAGFTCVSPHDEFGFEFGVLGTKTWTVSSSGFIEGNFDVTNKSAGCPRARNLTNIARLTSNSITITSSVKTPVESTNCGKNAEKKACNQGVGNGPEGCDPGNSNHNQPSNDENGGVPGAPGRQGS